MKYDTPYDRVPYVSRPFRQTHPGHLAAIARLHGVGAADPAKARVLEIGCAGGGNLLPMAERWPGGRFTGVDASARQIEDARRDVDALGLSNVEFVAADVAGWEPGGAGPFDYIICHGVYSWVSEAVRGAILDRLRDSLAPAGVGYVSYNTLPGWHLRRALRDVMRFRARAFDDPAEQLEQAKRVLSFLVGAGDAQRDPYAAALKREFDALSGAEDYYLIHEHLEEENAPCYFADFAAAAAQRGLAVLGEADYGADSTAELPPGVRDTLRAIARDRTEAGQYLDFLKNRAFRQTLLVHEAAAPTPEADPRGLLSLRVASPARPSGPTGGERGGGREEDGEATYRRGQATLRTRDPSVRATMAALRTAWPGRVPFPELAGRAQAQATGRPAAAGTDALGPAAERLAKTLIRCFETGLIDLQADAETFAAELSERPIASPAARRQAAAGTEVTTGHHTTARLEDVERRTLTLCDGTRNFAQIAAELAARVGDGRLALFGPGGAVRPGAEAEATLAPLVPAAVRRLAELGLLVKDTAVPDPPDVDAAP